MTEFVAFVIFAVCAVLVYRVIDRRRTRRRPMVMMARPKTQYELDNERPWGKVW